MLTHEHWPHGPLFETAQGDASCLVPRLTGTTVLLMSPAPYISSHWIPSGQERLSEPGTLSVTCFALIREEMFSLSLSAGVTGATAQCRLSMTGWADSGLHSMGTDAVSCGENRESSAISCKYSGL